MPLKKKVRKAPRAAADEPAEAPASSLPAKPAAGPAETVDRPAETTPAAGGEGRKKRKRPKAAAAAKTEPIEDAPAKEEPVKEGSAQEEPAKDPQEAEAEALLAQQKEDRRGIIHLAKAPPFMRVDKIRHLMDKYGRTNRIYLAPEDKTERMSRRRHGGDKRLKYVEGWIEFEDRKIARRVAATLHNTAIGGKKRHNHWRDDMWNMKYLPKFKWHQLKETEMYNHQVRKARLQQKINQARRESDFYLDQVEQAKASKRAAERRASKGLTPVERARAENKARWQEGEDPNVDDDAGGASDFLLESLIW